MILTRRGILRVFAVLLAALLLGGLLFLLAAGEALLLRRFAPELVQDPEFWRSQQLLYTLSSGGLFADGAADAGVSAVFAGTAEAQEVSASWK